MNNKIIDTERKTPGEIILKMLCINFSIAFTLFMLFSMFFGMIYADEEARAGIMYCWTIAGAMLLAVVLQLVSLARRSSSAVSITVRASHCSACASMRSLHRSRSPLVGFLLNYPTRG